MGDLPSVDKGRPPGALLYVPRGDIGSDSQAMGATGTSQETDFERREAIPSLLYGHALAGAAIILIGYLMAYLVSFESLIGSWTSTCVFTAVVMVMVMVLISVRNQEQVLPFGRAFGLSVLAGFLARLGYNVFNLLLFHVIRPDLLDPYVDLVVGRSQEALESLGVDLSRLGGAGSDFQGILEESTRYSLSVEGQLLDALTSLLWIAVVALIVSAILKRAPKGGGGFTG